jgi:hypothetical protein
LRCRPRVNVSGGCDTQGLITYLFGELVGVAAERMHVAKGGWRPPIAEEMHEFMHAFLTAEMETDRLLAEYWHLRRHNLLPEHVGVRRIGPWVSFV